jgi:cytochrome c-type biogenesis protein CcmH/NrfF
VRRHDLDGLSLLSGLVFLALGSAFLTGRVDVLRLNPLWLWPALAILVGVVLLAGLRRRS